MKDISANEVFCDLIGAELDKNQGRINKRGNFKNLENKLQDYKNRYINMLYIMGALESDNEIVYDEQGGDFIDIGNNKASPMAITSGCNISSLLGGSKDFISLIKKRMDLISK